MSPRQITRSGEKDFWSWFAPIGVLLVVVGVLVGLWFILPEYATQVDESKACPDTAEPSQLEPLAEGVVPAPLLLEDPEGVSISFGRDRGVHSKTVYLQVAKKSPSEAQTRYAPLKPETTYAVSERPLERQELEGTIGPTLYVSIADVTARKEVRLTVCADTTGTDIDPGTYVGSVRISGRGIQPVTVPVQVSLQYPGYRWLVPILGVATLIGGSFLVWASHKRAEPQGQASIWASISDFPYWIASNYVGVAGGVIATVSVFIAKYWRSPPWGARAPEDWFALLGVMFTAYTTTLTAATAIIGPRRDVETGGGQNRGEASETSWGIPRR